MTSAALLIMDVQQDVVERFAGDEGYLPRLATAADAHVFIPPSPRPRAT